VSSWNFELKRILKTQLSCNVTRNFCPLPPTSRSYLACAVRIPVWFLILPLGIRQPSLFLISVYRGHGVFEIDKAVAAIYRYIGATERPQCQYLMCNHWWCRESVRPVYPSPSAACRHHTRLEICATWNSIVLWITFMFLNIRFCWILSINLWRRSKGKRPICVMT
jgi:hypothetical protein